MSTRRNGILNVLSYFAVVFVGIALLLSQLLGNISALAQVANALNILAQLMAYIVVICHSYGYASARGRWWLAVWVVAVVLLAIFFVWGSISLFK